MNEERESEGALYDTGAISRMLSNNEAPLALRRKKFYESLVSQYGRDNVFLSPITIAELLYDENWYSTLSEATRETVDSFLYERKCLAITSDVGHFYPKMNWNKGKMPSDNDKWQITLAAYYNLDLVTTDKGIASKCHEFKLVNCLISPDE